MLNFLKYIMNYFKEDIPFDGYNPPPKNILMPKKCSIEKPISQNNKSGDNIFIIK